MSLTSYRTALPRDDGRIIDYKFHMSNKNQFFCVFLHVFFIKFFYIFYLIYTNFYTETPMFPPYTAIFYNLYFLLILPLF